jgi:acyl carrier protein
VPLPAYPFERERFWIEPQFAANGLQNGSSSQLSNRTGMQSIGSHSRPSLPSTFVPPSTEREKLVAGLWSSVLGISEIGIHDDFFELGGDSLLAIQALSRVRQNLGLDLPVQLFFQARTIAEVVSVLDEMQGRDAGKRDDAITPVARGNQRIQDLIEQAKKQGST